MSGFRFRVSSLKSLQTPVSSNHCQWPAPVHVLVAPLRLKDLPAYCWLQLSPALYGILSPTTVLEHLEVSVQPTKARPVARSILSVRPLMLSVVVLPVAILTDRLLERTRATCWRSLMLYFLVESHLVVVDRIKVAWSHSCGGQGWGVLVCRGPGG